MEKNSVQERCLSCQQICTPVDVHGHLQCNICGQVMESCCRGAPDGEKQEEWR